MTFEEKIEKMYSVPGFYWIGGERCAIVEIDGHGACHQIDHAYKRDGELSKDGWEDGNGEIAGPFPSGQEADHAWQRTMAWNEICAS